ncbi:MAG: response regulator [Verrucomicrobiota bacterium]|jgi:CheY-like chemotaxis protein
MNTECILYATADTADATVLQQAFLTAAIPNHFQIVSDGQEATEYLSRTGAFTDRFRYRLPCLMLLDLNLARKTGLETLAWLRAQPDLHCLPVIVFSIANHPLDFEKACLLGANSYVVKPGAVDEKIQFAKSIQAFWLRFNHPLSLAA